MSLRQEEHLTRVEDAIPRSSHRLQAWCVVCGLVGQPQELRGDAEAIADRHHEIGGFERRGA